MLRPDSVAAEEQDNVVPGDFAEDEDTSYCINKCLAHPWTLGSKVYLTADRRPWMRRRMRRRSVEATHTQKPVFLANSSRARGDTHLDANVATPRYERTQQADWTPDHRDSPVFNEPAGATHSALLSVHFERGAGRAGTPSGSRNPPEFTSPNQSMQQSEACSTVSISVPELHKGWSQEPKCHENDGKRNNVDHDSQGISDHHDHHHHHANQEHHSRLQ